MPAAIKVSNLCQYDAVVHFMFAKGKACGLVRRHQILNINLPGGVIGLEWCPKFAADRDAPAWAPAATKRFAAPLENGESPFASLSAPHTPPHSSFFFWQ